MCAGCLVRHWNDHPMQKDLEWKLTPKETLSDPPTYTRLNVFDEEFFRKIIRLDDKN